MDRPFTKVTGFDGGYGGLRWETPVTLGQLASYVASCVEAFHQARRCFLLC